MIYEIWIKGTGGEQEKIETDLEGYRRYIDGTIDKKVRKDVREKFINWKVERYNIEKVRNSQKMKL